MKYFRMYKTKNINESLFGKLEKHWLLEKFDKDNVNIFDKNANKLFSSHYSIYKKVKKNRQISLFFYF
jgi:hypothetical protein